MNSNKFLKFVKIVKIRWPFWGYVYIDNGVFQKAHKQQQNVMLRGTDPCMTSFITRSKRKQDDNVIALSNLSSHYG